MFKKKSLIRKIVAAMLCLSLLLGIAASFAETDVSNVTDNEGPRLSNFTFKQNGKTLKPGDKLNVSLTARDRSGISYVVVEFLNEKAGASISIFLNYNQATDKYEGEQELWSDLPNGEYIINAISGNDQYDNTRYYFTDNPKAFGKFKLKEANSYEDTTPTVKAEVKIKENGKKVKPKDQIHIEAKLKTKMKKKVAYLGIDLQHQTIPWMGGLWCILYYNPDTGKYEGTCSFGYEDEGKIKCDSANGTYEATMLWVMDENGDVLGKAAISGQSVTLTKSFTESTPPEISSVKLKEKGKTLHPGDTLHLKVKAKDDSEVTDVYAYAVPADVEVKRGETSRITVLNQSGFIPFRMSKVSKDVWEGEASLSKETVNGTYYILVGAQDKAYNYTDKEEPKQKFKFKGDDFVTDEIHDFVVDTYFVLTGEEPTEEQVNSLGMKLAKGTDKAVNTVKRILDGAKLSNKDKVTRLYIAMKSAVPTDSELAEWTAKLDGGTKEEELIDALADTEEFRGKCNNARIPAGTFGVNKDGVELGDTAVKKIKLNKKKATLKITSKQKKPKVELKATITPDNATNTEVKWSSSDESVAKVNSKGKVTAVGAGKCTITCEALDGSGKTAKCKITVKDMRNSGNTLKVSKDHLTLKVGKKKQLEVESDGQELKWSSSNKDIAKVNSKGKVTAVSAGECIITCETEDGSAKVEIPVKVK